jgi:hypothetical protein
LAVFLSAGILFVLMAEVEADIFNAVVMIVMCGGHVNTFRLKTDRFVLCIGG